MCHMDPLEAVFWEGIFILSGRRVKTSQTIISGSTLVYLYSYTNSLVNADLFYVNFTNMTFQKIPIPHMY